MPLRIERMRDVPVPEYASAEAAGFDLSLGAFLSWQKLAPVDKPGDEDIGIDYMLLRPGAQVWVGTGIRPQFPAGNMLLLAPRSGRGACEGLVLGNCAAFIDSDYRAEIKLALLNRGHDPLLIERRDRVAQAALVPVEQAEIIDVASIDATDRGGFGSSGR